MQSYAQTLVILGDADLNAVFHLLGINSRNSRLILNRYLTTQAPGDANRRVLVFYRLANYPAQSPGVKRNRLLQCLMPRVAVTPASLSKWGFL